MTEESNAAKAKALADPKKAIAPVTKYKVITHLNHDGQDYLPGALVPLGSEDARSLQEIGVVEEG